MLEHTNINIIMRCHEDKLNLRGGLISSLDENQSYDNE